MAKNARVSADAVPAIGVLTDLQKFTASAAFVDAQGSPVTSFASAPVWASADSTHVGVIAAADGMSCEIDGLLATGLDTDGVTPLTVAVTCTATNADGTTAVLTGAIQVLASDATTGGLSFGAPSTR